MCIPALCFAKGIDINQYHMPHVAAEMEPISMNEHPIKGLMDSTIQKIKDMVDGNTIIGDPITTPEGAVIIPVSKVHLGFASGGSDFGGKNPEKDRFGGGAGAGLTVSPVAFLVLNGGTVRLIQLAEKNNTAERAINLVPEVMDKVTELAALFAAKKDADAAKSGTQQ